MMLIDTHAHLNFNAYKEDSDDIIKESLDNNTWVINVGSQYTVSKRAVEMAEGYREGIYAAVGLHPIHLETGLVKIKSDPEEIQFNAKEENFDFNGYRELAESKKVVAIGETGFDYYWKPKSKSKIEEFKEKQKIVFLDHVKLAEELNLPLVIHCRMAHEELIETLLGLNSKPKGVIHCFTGNLEEAQKYLDMGFYLGFNGIIFKMNLEEAIKEVPLEKMVLETDCPYLTPPAVEGRNKPLYMKYTAERIAQIKNISFEEVAKTTTQNARELFKI